MSQRLNILLSLGFMLLFAGMYSYTGQVTQHLSQSVSSNPTWFNTTWNCRSDVAIDAGKVYEYWIKGVCKSISGPFISIKTWPGQNTQSPSAISNQIKNPPVQPEYSLTNTTDGGGSVSRDHLGPYPDGDVVQIPVVPDKSGSSDDWTDDLTGTASPESIGMDENNSVTADSVRTPALPKDLIVNQGTLREDFETMNDWIVTGSAPGYAAVIDSTIYKVGTRSIKVSTPVNGTVRITKSVNWDLSAPTEQGNFRLWVYVSDAGEPKNFQILMSNNADFKNHFIAWLGGGIEFRNRPGWNLINLRTSDWNTGGGLPSWANPIVQIRFRFDGNTADSFALDGLSSGVIAQPAVLFTFDDGLSSLFTQAYAYMKTRNVRGTGYSVADWVNGKNQATWPQLQELYTAGWTIGNHTNTHPQMPLLSEAAQESELLTTRNAFNEHGMTNVDYVGYPHGEYDPNTIIAMEKLGIRNGRTLLSGNSVSPIVNPYEIPQHEVGSSVKLTIAERWVDTAKSRQEILVITFHDITAAPTPDSDDWSIDNFQSFVDYCIQQGLSIITMEDLYSLQYGSISIPEVRSKNYGNKGLSKE